MTKAIGLGTHCADCGAQFIPTEHTTGYGVSKDNKRICYACCGLRDRVDMIATGKAVLYLTLDEGALHRGHIVNMGVDGAMAKPGKVSNWPGTLSFTVQPGTVKRGRHNFAGNRYDVWFIGPDGANWHGVQYGDNTQLCHCTRIKS